MAGAAVTKAAVCRRYGPPDVVQVEERLVPRPRDDEVALVAMGTARTSARQ
jgi:hypothetical protein